MISTSGSAELRRRRLGQRGFRRSVLVSSSSAVKFGQVVVQRQRSMPDGAARHQLQYLCQGALSRSSVKPR